MTPPYLTVVPEVKDHKLTARDKFLVVGSDGLWDMMTPMQVIRLVGEHMSGKVVLNPLTLTENMGLPLEDIMGLLSQRNNAMKLKPQVRYLFSRSGLIIFGFYWPRPFWKPARY